MGQALFGEEIEREGGPSVVGDSLGLVAELGLELVVIGVRIGAQQVGRVPQLPLPLVQLHELPDPALKVPQHFDFGLQLAGGVGYGTHECPGTRLALEMQTGPAP